MAAKREIGAGPPTPADRPDGGVKMTPAERLAAGKRPADRRRHAPRRKVWECLVGDVRVALRLTLKDVAAATGLSVACLWEVEQGSDPQLTTARRLAAFFGKTVEEVWPEPAGGGA